ncbi:MAG: 16S rRNA (adenine(1518)-N(6)/adenine(1519)-N(6))-dimethyltransferase RsmA [Acidobacteria bacterium]|nr:16S rRNA (adenine(1518)-N(6)/adenine(1519)-N(6))-dimethyltransferase RsmA [Acidobacteriota bacterium]
MTDRRIEERILRSLHLEADDTVLEIGAGKGNMTELLARQAASVRTVEIDSRLVSLLREKFAGNGRVEVLAADILKLPLDSIAGSANQRRIKVFGNLPYYITSACLLHLFQYHRWIEEIVVMVQHEVAERIVAAPGSGDYGLLSITCQYYTQPELLFSISPKAFRPQPKVYSALLRMPVAPQGDALGITDKDEAAFWRFVKAAFAQRRKTLFNNLKAICDTELLRHALERLQIDARARAETLSLAQFASLAKALRKGD